MLCWVPAGLVAVAGVQLMLPAAFAFHVLVDVSVGSTPESKALLPFLSTKAWTDIVPTVSDVTPKLTTPLASVKNVPWHVALVAFPPGALCAVCGHAFGGALPTGASGP